MKKIFVLIDYENVQPDAVGLLDQDHFNIIVFVGASQSRITFEIASVLQPMGERVEYVKIAGNGKNALDFHIAFYIGQIAADYPDAYFHIISKDSGFDPLIEHLKGKKILAGRTSDIAGMMMIKATNPNFNSTAGQLDLIVGDLRRRGVAAPKTFKALSSTVHSLFQKQLPEQELARLLDELQKQGWATMNGAKVSYRLPC